MASFSLHRIGPVLLVLLCGYGVAAQVSAPVNFRTEAALLKKLIQKQHYIPPAIDDAFSAALLDAFLNDLDPDRIVFTATEVQALTAFRDKLDDEINGTSWTFLPLATKSYQKALARAGNAIVQGTQRPFDFTIKELYTEDTLWTKDEAFVFERWRVLLKHEALVRLADIRDRYASEPDAAFIKNHEAPVRTLVRTINQGRISRVVNHPSGFENYVGTALLRAFANTVDAHTNYFSPKEMEDFMSEVSSEGYLFGFQLKENEVGDVTIDQLTPGGPAWKSGIIYAGDVMERMRWEGQDWIELAGLDAHEVGLMLNESNHHALELSLRSVSGQEKKVLLKKEKMADNENVVKSFVLQGEHTIGYIYLPGFYTDWGAAGGSQCANDVAAAIIKLKKENIEGIILDVRFNGGGSLEEAVAMAGIFIDAGPIGLLRNKAGELITVKDINRGTIYNGPLVLMVNAMSASASEFLAAALQDYRRAIIVGDRTCGKATSQYIHALDPKRVESAFSGVTKSLYGYTTVTEQKIYRINGKTAQRKGVTPDIQLPDILDALELREEDMEHTFPSDSVQKKTYYTPFPLLPLKTLRQKSHDRVEASSGFKQQRLFTGFLKAREAGGISLLFTDMMSWRKRYQGLEQVAGKGRITDAYRVNLLQTEQAGQAADEYTRNFNTAWTNKLLQDIYLEESFYIINDQINQEKKP